MRGTKISVDSCILHSRVHYKYFVLSFCIVLIPFSCHGCNTSVSVASARQGNGMVGTVYWDTCLLAHIVPWQSWHLLVSDIS